MKRNTVGSFLVAVVAAGVFTSAALAKEQRTFCSDTLVRGTYAVQLQGTQAMPDGSTANIIGVVIRFYDGQGVVTQWDNVKNSATGYTPNRYGSGTYRVNDDCTVDIEFRPAPSVTIQERAVVIDGGRELRSITVLPAGLFVTSTSQRI